VAILTELIQYTKVYFLAEEKYLESIGYPDSEAQLSEHAWLVRELTVIVCECKAGKLLISKKRMTFHRKWLTNHINMSKREV